MASQTPAANLPVGPSNAEMLREMKTLVNNRFAKVNSRLNAI